MRTCTELVASNASKTDIRRYSADGDHVSVVLRIRDALRAAAKEGASLCSMTLSAFSAHLHNRKAREEGGIEA